MSDRELAPRVAGARTQLPALATGLILMVAMTGYPRFVVDPTGRPDHMLALAAFWAMTAGFVRGVGFVPRTACLRWAFSGWACAAALAAAAAVISTRVG